MACPFFLPLERFSEGNWPHPLRLPLGDGWRGTCTAPGQQNVAPTDQELHELCNLGYPTGCARFPRGRAADAVRFAVVRDRGHQLQLCYVCEREHLPAEYGTLEYDVSSRAWASAHRDQCIQRMAACFVESYLRRRQGSCP
jgi:hypothetical protein